MFDSFPPDFAPMPWKCYVILPGSRRNVNGDAGVKYANDSSILLLKISAVLDGAESHKLESP